MCLTTKQKWPKIAWKPITTYKVVYISNKSSSLLTLFQNFPIQIGRTYKETLINIFRGREKNTFNYCIYEGLHSHTKENRAKICAEDYRYLGTIVVKCIIPKFSFYWIGEDNDIVSNKLKYVKIL